MTKPKDVCPNKKKHTAVVIISAIVVLLLAAGGFLAKKLYDDEQIRKILNSDKFYNGIYVEDISLSGKTLEQAKAEIKSNEPKFRDKYDINIVYNNKSWKITEDDLEFDYDTDEVLKKAFSYAREGSDEERLKKIEELKTSPQKFSITSTVNCDSIKPKLKEKVKGIAYPAVDATVASFDTKTVSFKYADGKNGLAVEEDKLFNQVVEIIKGEKKGTVNVPTKVIPFETSVAQVKSHLQKLGTYSTTSTNNANGNYNMAKALKRINGTCVPAGGVFSFHGTVGNSNKANGYLPAGALENGRPIQSYGGGICQASTTVYGAAIRSNMKIISRKKHSIPSKYCPIGQDAAVSYPNLDFKFQNTSKYPVYIVSGMNGRTLTVTFYGYQPSDYDKIVVTSKKTQTIPAPSTAKYTVDNSLKAGSKRLDSKARAGSKAVAQRTFYKNGAVVKTENLPSSYYPPLPAFYSVGPSAETNSSSI